MKVSRNGVVPWVEVKLQILPCGCSVGSLGGL